jgi:hypothetical protein
MSATAILVRIDRTAGRTQAVFDRGPDWMFDDRRNCADDDRRPLFYSHKDRDQARARRFCGTCPFTDDCLTYALGDDKRLGERHGVWGGVLMSSAAEREAGQKRLQAVPA